MKLESIKVNGEELTKEEIADLFVNRPRNGYYVKGLAEGDEVIVSDSFDGLPLDLKIKNNSGIIYFGFFKFVYSATAFADIEQFLELTPYPVKFLFRVIRLGGYNRLILRGFAYEQHLVDDVYIRYIGDSDSDEERLREEVKKDKQAEDYL